MADRKLRIMFLLPGITKSPIGGFKVVFEYANRLARDGHHVSIAYAGIIPREYVRKPFIEKLATLKRLIPGFRENSCRCWFELDRSVKELYPVTLSYKPSMDADVYIATACTTTKYLLGYPARSKKIYLIQGYEDWSMTAHELNETYAYPFHKIVVSNWLHRLLSERGFESTVVPNGFDEKQYHLTIPIKEKKRLQVSVLYHIVPLKGFRVALEALRMVREHYDIHVTAFGANSPTEALPAWMDFHLSPSPEEHLRINNESALFIASSFSEGWGLTIGEAMMCGQAVVCTDTKGFLEMAIHGHNALVVPVGDAKAMAEAIITLLDDNALRCRLAQQGLEDIRKFNIEESYMKFRQMIEE